MNPCGSDTPVREPIAATTDQKISTVRGVIAQVFAVFMAALREIFDEAAYERFLNRQSLISSPRAYGDFLHETEAAKARRPRCC